MCPVLNWEIKDWLCFTLPSLRGSNAPKTIPHSAVSSKFCLQASFAAKATTNIILILQLRWSRPVQPELLCMNWLHTPLVPWKCLGVKTSPFWSSHNRRRKVRHQGLFFLHSKWHCTEKIKREGLRFFFFFKLYIDKLQAWAKSCGPSIPLTMPKHEQPGTSIRGGDDARARQGKDGS